MRVLESLGGYSREPASAVAEVQSAGKREVSPDDCRAVSPNCVLRMQRFRGCSQSHSKTRPELTRSRIFAARRPPRPVESVSGSCDGCC